MSSLVKPQVNPQVEQLELRVLPQGPLWTEGVLSGWAGYDEQVILLSLLGSKDPLSIPNLPNHLDRLVKTVSDSAQPAALRIQALMELHELGPAAWRTFPAILKALVVASEDCCIYAEKALWSICLSAQGRSEVWPALASATKQGRLASILQLVILLPEVKEALRAMKGQEVHPPSVPLQHRPVPADNLLEYIEAEFHTPSAVPRSKVSPASAQLPPSSIEGGKQSLSALLDRSETFVPVFTSLVQKKAQEKFPDDPKVVAAVIETVREAFLLLFSQPPAPALKPATPESPEPSIDLSGNVPEQVNQLCLWFRARVADADTAAGAERERRRESTVAKFQTQINTLIGGTFGAEGNAAIVKGFRETLKATKYRVQCKCGFPGLPYYQLAERSNATDGAFQIIHYYKGGQTYHGGPASFPGYSIVPAPAAVAARRPPAPSRQRSR